MIIPTVIDRDRGSDLFSRLLQDRIILLTGPVDSNMADIAIAELLYLDSQSHDDIQLYINSPGGSISDGMAIYDTMNIIKSDVSTICVGCAASMGAFLLSGGAPGKRYALPNAEIMIHQPLIGGGGISGQATDIFIHAKHLEKTKDRMAELFAKHTGKTVEQIKADTERDNWLSAHDAMLYGLVDKVLD